MATNLESKTRRGEGDCYSYSIVLAERDFCGQVDFNFC